MTKSDRVNYLNIILMLVAGVLAYFFPFRLFLAAYAILGPLHYLTEISWLHDRTYFVQSRKAALLLWTLGIAIFLDRYVVNIAPVQAMIFFAFFAAIILVFVAKKRHLKKLLLFIAFLVSILLVDNPLYLVIFGIFLTSIIHVYFFTFCFMLYGGLKEKSQSAFLSVIVFLLVSTSFFVISAKHSLFATNSFIEANYAHFAVISQELFRFFGFGTIENVFTSSALIPLLQFLAFAYTYHYLNWFSKTSVIGWNNISVQRGILIVVLWAAALGLYWYSYELGLAALYFLSMAHVLLEFPLNHISLVGIGKECRRLVWR